MPDLTIGAGGLRPLIGSTVVPMIAGGTLALNDAVKIATTGKVIETTGASDKCAGLVVSTDGKDSSAATDETVGVLTFGRVAGFSGLTPGKLVYLSATAGALADSGTVAVGYTESSEVVMFMPGVTNAAS